MRFPDQITDNDVLDAIRDLGYVATLPALLRLISARHGVEKDDEYATKKVRDQISRRLSILVKYRFITRTGQKRSYKYRIEE